MSDDPTAHDRVFATRDASVARRPRRTARGTFRLTVGAFVALVAALLPLLRVITPGFWLAAALGLAALVLTIGYLLRVRGVPAWAVSLIELVVWMLGVTGLFFAGQAWLLVIPSPAVFAAVPEVLSRAAQDIITGYAPLDATAAIAFLLVSSVALLAIALDHIVVTARMPLLAVVALLTVALIPTVSVQRSMPTWELVTLGATFLLLFRFETHTRREPERPGAVRTAAGFVLGAAALVTTLIVAPLLPTLNPVVLVPGSVSVGVDASIDLGRNLRNPASTEILTVTTDTGSAPYLRLATLSLLQGSGTWVPDAPSTTAIGSDGTFPAQALGSTITTTEAQTQIDISRLDTTWLPVPYPAASISGLTGSWAIADQNLTVESQGGSTRGQQYTVTTTSPQPTLEQIEAAPARSTNSIYTVLPQNLPTIITSDAQQVTAGATSAYDKLIALQTWFRGDEFTYSLNAPVEQGFDGSSADAVARFLQVKSGYCVHYASAFTLMARSLGIPTRIVIGYLPGTYSSSTPDTVTYKVVSDQLHAWPEAYFQGIGWVRFEPTKSLGVSTSFAPGSGTSGTVDSSGSTPQPTASSAPTAAPSDQPSTAPTTGTTTSTTSTSGPAIAAIVPWALGAVLVIAVLAVPGVLGAARARRLRAAAARGDAVAAWGWVQDAARDVGVPVSAAASPREFGAALIAQPGVPAEAVWRLVDAVERAAYAPPPAPTGRRARRAASGDPATADAAAAVRSGVLGSVAPARRLIARVWPRSLWARE
ncbi:MAG: hypothetical protein ABT08_01955 [Microbacterium sp. SCN 71-21]|uniref:transglutaminase family protein n=1 Tax=Microbacterium sp. SCN 71-21 TaxID=1660116 RepID=UPI000869FAEF|nr:DUF3488 and transglutaminase-like domain-containing protein [Microbacterium sp. SCN 71-21]ODU79252.1 MAG: hypothetical protein ABT08_01955 [Microbacterium sp. SCN 71-21]